MDSNVVQNIPTTPLKNPSTPRKQEKNTPKQQGSSKTYEEYWNGKQVEEGLENGSLIQVSYILVIIKMTCDILFVMCREFSELIQKTTERLSFMHQ